MDKSNYHISFHETTMLEAKVNLFEMHKSGVVFDKDLIEDVGFSLDTMPNIRVRGFVDNDSYPAFEFWYTLDGYGVMSMAFGIPVGEDGMSNEELFRKYLELVVTAYLDWDFLASLLG